MLNFAHHTVGCVRSISEWQSVSPEWFCSFIYVAFWAFCSVSHLSLEDLHIKMPIVTHHSHLSLHSNIVDIFECSPLRPVGWPYLKSSSDIQLHHVVHRLQNTYRLIHYPESNILISLKLLNTAQLTIFNPKCCCDVFCSACVFLQVFKDFSELKICLWLWIQPLGRQPFLSE